MKVDVEVEKSNLKKLSVEPERDHIETLHRESAKNDKIHMTLSRTLEKDINTSFKGGHKFIFELMQNADDAAENQIDVYFSIVFVGNTNFLIFSHDGAHFSNDDVERICDNARHDGKKKSMNVEKTGYKGIGFKAVFSVADSATIFSGKYQFRFDRNFEQWKNGFSQDKPYPWAIIPIWTPDDFFSKTVLKQLDRSKVSVILTLKPGIDVKKSLDFIKDSPEMLIFLRKVRAIQVTDKTGTKTISVHQKTITNEIIEKSIFTNNSLMSTWWLYRLSIKIPLKTKRYLETLEHSECPERLKNAEQTDITFGISVFENGSKIDKKQQISVYENGSKIDKKQQISVYENGSKIDKKQQNNFALFCYLPTQVNCGLPFLVNGDFLLNAERTHLMDNEWNDFLLSNIAYYQFDLLAKLTALPLRHSILHYLSNSEIKNVSDTANLAFKNGYKQGQKDFAFIPAFRSDILLTCDKARIDIFNFFKIFSIDFTGIVEHQLEDIKILQEKLNTNVFAEEELCAFILSYKLLKDISFQVKLLSFFSKVTCNSEEKLLSSLKATPFLLTASNRLARPNELFFSLQPGINIPEILSVDLIHPNLRDLDSNVTNWVKAKLGVNEGGILQILRTRGFSILKNSNENKDHEKLLAVTILAFQAFSNECLEKYDTEFLSQNLMLITQKNELVLSSKAYLSEIYEPEFNLEGKIKQDIFVSSIYWKNKNVGNDKKLWKNFFINVGVRDKLRLEYSNYQNVFQVKMNEIYGVHRFIKELEDRGTCPKTRNYENFLIENFYYFPLIEHIANDPLISKFFWEEIKKNWEDMKTHPSKFITAQGQKRDMDNYSYLQYVLKNEKLLCSMSSKDRYNTDELYDPSLKPFQEFLPVADVVDLSEEQSIYFGFNQMKFEHCLTILNEFDKKGVNNPKSYALLFKCLLLLKLDDKERKQLKFWSGRLLAQDNTLQNKNSLLCFSIKGQRPPFNSPKYIKKLPGISDEQLVEISKLFGINIMCHTKGELKYNINDCKLDDTGKEAVRNYLTTMAYIVSRQSDVSKEEIYRGFLVKFNHLKCYVLPRMTLNYENNSRPVLAHLIENKLYYVKNWSNKKTISQLVECLIEYLNVDPESKEEIISLFDSDSKEDWCIENDVNQTDLPDEDASDDDYNPEKESESSDDDEDSTDGQVISCPSTPETVTIFQQKFTPDIDEKSTDKLVNSKTETIFQPKFTSDIDEKSTDKLVNSKTETIFQPKITPDIDEKSKVKDEIFKTETTFQPKIKPDIDEKSKVKEVIFKTETIFQPKIAPDIDEESKDKEVNSYPFIPETETTFKLEITPDKLNISNVKIKKAELLLPLCNPIKKPYQKVKNHNKSRLSDVSKVLIGRAGEETVYRKLREHYESKYQSQNCKVKETDEGFVIEEQNGDNPKQKLEVIWHNKERECGKPKDFTVKKGECGKSEDFTVKRGEGKRIIEVKSTQSFYNYRFNVSVGEMEKLKKYGKNFRFFRVYGVGATQPEIYIIKDPSSAIINQKLQVTIKSYIVVYHQDTSSKTSNN